MKIIYKEIQCKSAVGKCGFPGGGLSINPYVGCEHDCCYCYARFMKRFSGHADEKWGAFVDARMNIAEVLAKQMKSKKYRGQQIHIGTVTDPYQEAERKYQLTRKVLEVLKDYENPVSILTKSDLVLRDINLFKQFKDIDINLTINTFDEKWKKRIEPNSPSIERRLEAIKKLAEANIRVNVMMGPYWPEFTVPEVMIKKFKELGVSEIFSESLNTIGGNWSGVEEVLRQHYPQLLPKFRRIFFNGKESYAFHRQAQEKLENLCRKYKIPVSIYFGFGHAAKFKKKS